MKTFILILLFGFINNFCYTQTNAFIAEKRNVYNDKGNYYFDRNEFKKAIIYYNLAYQKDTSDYFSILKKAEAYAQLKLYAQAEECYRIVFESNLPISNAYRLKYALVLLANNKPEDFKHWLGIYSQIVDEEVKSENYLVSSDKKIQLYKDTSIVLVSGDHTTDTIHYKIKYAGYQYRKRSTGEDNQLYVVLSNGDEYSIAASGTKDFKFSFQPMENYKLIIQRENLKAEDILNDKQLTAEQQKRIFLSPPPTQKDELKLQKGMQYQFSSGQYKITPQYLNTLKEMAANYQSPNANTVDLTALVKEQQLVDGEIYTIKFERIVDPNDSHKKLEISIVTMNEKTINIYGQSFLLVLPDRAAENFAIQTDIEAIKKNFSPKQYSLIVDDKPLFKVEEQPAPKWLLSLTVNTNSVEEVKPINRLSAKEITIIPGTEYILTLSKRDPTTGKNIETIVPLTRSVKYNLTSSQENNAEFKENLAKFLIGREGVELANEEVIDISVLSKELELQPGEDLSFTLLPVKQPGKKAAVPEGTKTILTLDGKVFEITRDQKYTINVPFNLNRKVNLQTDLDYMQKNFKAVDIALRLDTVSFTSEISIDTTGYGEQKSSGWLVSMSVNTDSIEEVERQNQFTAKEVSIIPGKEYILTVSKFDAETGKDVEVIVPLTRHVKYNFTSNPVSEDAYKASLDKFIAGRENLETTEGEVIDIRIISKELQIKEGDKVSFSLLPVKNLSKKPSTEVEDKSTLYLDNKVVEFTHIQKYTINVPLTNERQVNIQTDLGQVQANFNPSSIALDFDTIPLSLKLL